MTLDGFLTFLTLIIAALAITPAVVRLRLRLKWKIPVAISLICFVLVIYLEFYAAVKLPCPGKLASYCGYLTLKPDSLITPSQWAFIVVIAWLVFAGFAMRRSKVSTSSLPTLSELVSELVYERRYAELVPLLEPVLPLLNRVANRKLIFQRLRDWLEDRDLRRAPMERLLAALEEGDRPTNDGVVSWLKHRLNIALSKVAYVVPSGRSAERAAKEILRVLFRTPAFLDFVATYRPEFGVKMLACDVTEVHDFCDEFLTALISSPQSLLFNEVKQNQNQARNGYYYPEHNRLLHFLFGNAANAERLAVYKPVGDYIIAKIRAENVEYVRYLNGPADLFQNDERWEDATYVAIRFFDLMVSAAIWEGIKWHMWLFYFPPFMEQLVGIYDAGLTDILYQRDREFIALARRDPEGPGMGWKSVEQAGDSPAMSAA